MNTLEMMNKLYENPKLKAKSHNCTFSNDILINDSGALIWENSRKNGSLSNGDYYLFECCTVNMLADWEIIQEPVTWQEAIQAKLDGKNVYFIKTNGCKYVLDDNLEIFLDNFKTSKWYIES